MRSVLLSFLVLLSCYHEVVLSDSTASSSADRPLLISRTGWHSCLLFNDSRGLVCDIVADDAANAIRLLPPLPWSISSLSLVIQPARDQSEVEFLLPVETLTRFGQLELLQVRNHRERPFGVATCSLQSLATSLRSLKFFGFCGIFGFEPDQTDPFCTNADSLTSLKLVITPGSTSCRWCYSFSGLIHQSASSLKELHLSLPSDCSLAEFQVENLPQLERLLLRTTQPVGRSGDDIRRRNLTTYRSQLRFQEESLSGLRFTNLPSLKRLTLTLHHKIAVCHNGSVFGPGSFVNLTSLTSLTIGDMFVTGGRSLFNDRCELLGPGAFQGGSEALQRVSLGAGFMVSMIFNLRNNPDLLLCRNCSEQRLVIGEAAWMTSSFFSNPNRCKLLLPEERALSITHLRVAKCKIGPIEASVMSRWPQLQSIITESDEKDLNDGDNDDAGETKLFDENRLLVTRLNLDDLTEYASNNLQLREVTIFAEQCNCSQGNVSEAASALQMVSIGCANFNLEPFNSLTSALEACSEFAAFPVNLQNFLAHQDGQCVGTGPASVSCVITHSFFNNSMPLPFGVNHFDCLLKLPVPILTRDLLAKAKNLRTLVLSGSRLYKFSIEGLHEIEDGAFEALQKLETLVLRNNHLRNIRSRTFTGLARLRSLDLSSNFYLKRIHPEALKPTAGTLQFLRLTVREAAQVGMLISQSGLVRLETLNVEMSTNNEPADLAESHTKPTPIELPTGSVVDLPELRELAILFDDYWSPRGVLLRQRSIANLPSLQSLSVRLNHRVSSVTLENEAFYNIGLTGVGLDYLLMQSLQPPVPDSNWIELLSGSGISSQEVILGFANPPTSFLFDSLDLANVSFNTSRLSLSIDRGCLVLNQQDLGTLGRLFPRMRKLNLQSFVAIDLTNDTFDNVLFSLRSSAVFLTQLDAVPSNCSAQSPAIWQAFLDGVNFNDTRIGPRLKLRLSCPETDGACDFDNNASPNLVPHLLVTIILVVSAILL